MKYNTYGREELSRTERRYRLAKNIIFISLTVFFYVLMRIGVFGLWQPVFIIPLAVSFSMYHDELASCLFALFGGYMIDIAYGFTFGFSAVWLMAVCVGSAVLVRNLIRVNIINFIIITVIAVLIEFSMDYLFNVVIWNIPRGDIILTSSIIPTATATAMTSPLIYLLVGRVEQRLGRNNAGIVYYDPVQPGQEEED